MYWIKVYLYHQERNEFIDIHIDPSQISIMSRIIINNIELTEMFLKNKEVLLIHESPNEVHSLTHLLNENNINHNMKIHRSAAYTPIYKNKVLH